MMSRSILFISIIAFSSIFFTACEKDDPIIPNEEELITTVNYTLVPESGGAEVVFTFKDLDGDGGNAPEISGGTLESNTTYTAKLELLNESSSPIEDITEEVKEEGTDHQFFFSSTINDLSIAYADQDDNGDAIGIESAITTGANSSGSITITLRHEPNKEANGVASGDITNAGGETDIEVIFPVDVQ